MGLGDIRRIGSGNIGATNVLRTGNRLAAALTLVLDAGKGAIAVVAARLLVGEDAAQVAGGFAFLGHLWPVWLGFRGGKGVATFLGTILALAWPLGRSGLRHMGGDCGADAGLLALRARRGGARAGLRRRSRASRSTSSSRSCWRG
jgi:hypothetical protein